MLTTYLLYRAPYTQAWGGYVYEKGTPRGIGLHVQRSGVDFLFSKTFGAGADVYVGAEATERLAQMGYERFASEVELMASIPPVLSFNMWLYDNEQMTPEVLIRRGSRLLAGLSPRLNEEEAYMLPAAVAERADRAERERRRQREEATWRAEQARQLGRRRGAA